VTKLSSYINKIQIVLKRYLKGKWGFPFIVAFLLLLLTAAIFLVISATSAELTATSTSFASMAEITAEFSYFALAIGVLFQLGNVNSKTFQSVIAWIKKLKIALQHVLLGKNRLKNGVLFDGPS
jgi:hypothetical protein